MTMWSWCIISWPSRMAHARCAWAPRARWTLPLPRPAPAPASQAGCRARRWPTRLAYALAGFEGIVSWLLQGWRLRAERVLSAQVAPTWSYWPGGICCKRLKCTLADSSPHEPARAALQGSLGAHAAAERAGSLGGRGPLLERPASGSMLPGSFGGLPTRFTVTTGETFVLPPPPSAAAPRPPAAGFQPPAGKVGLLASCIQGLGFCH